MMNVCKTDTTTEQQQPEETAAGQLRIIRPCRWARSAVTFRVLVDGTEVGRLPNGKTLTVMLPPGERSVVAVPTSLFWGIPSTPPVCVTISAGETASLGLEFTFGGTKLRLQGDGATTASLGTSQANPSVKASGFWRIARDTLAKELVGPKTVKRVQIGLILLFVLIGGFAVAVVKSREWHAATKESDQRRNVTVDEVIDGKRFEVTYRRREHDTYGSLVKPDAAVSPKTHDVISVRPKD